MYIVISDESRLEDNHTYSFSRIKHFTTESLVEAEETVDSWLEKFTDSHREKDGKIINNLLYDEGVIYYGDVTVEQGDIIWHCHIEVHEL